MSGSPSDKQRRQRPALQTNRSDETVAVDDDEVREGLDELRRAAASQAAAPQGKRAVPLAPPAVEAPPPKPAPARKPAEPARPAAKKVEDPFPENMATEAILPDDPRAMAARARDERPKPERAQPREEPARVDRARDDRTRDERAREERAREERARDDRVREEHVPSDRPEDMMTAVAKRMFTLAEMFGKKLKEVRVTSDVQLKAVMMPPDVASTDGGRKAREPIALVPVTDDKRLPLICGFVDVAKKTAELRTFRLIERQHQARGQPLAVELKSYVAFLQSAEAFLLGEGLKVTMADDVDSVAVPPSPRKGSTAYFVLGVVLMLSLGGAVMLLLR